MDIEKAIKNFKINNFEVSSFKTKEEATDYLVNELNNLTIGFGDSETLNEMKLYEKLSVNNKVIDPQHCVDGKDFYETARECLTTDIFFTSVNGAGETGELVNIDGTGNRIAGSLFGHKKVYFVFGTNKLEEDLGKAISRASNIAAPENAIRHHYKTPCALGEKKCYDCKSKDRICNAMTIYMKKLNNMDMELVIIEENLGI